MYEAVMKGYGAFKRGRLAGENGPLVITLEFYSLVLLPALDAS